jgi:glycosyltransferase involved in cell wall biosynthesis
MQSDSLSAGLKNICDAVVMLTWSDWHREPRSNRYHYATRFAREVPVVFVQPDLPVRDGRFPNFSAERVDGHDITIVHVPEVYGWEQTAEMNRALQSLAIRRPLLWIYNVYFEDFVRRAQARMRVYHATEDYLSPKETMSIAGSAVNEPLKRILRDMDMVVSVSDGVARSYEAHGAYDGPSLVLRNGCDFDFWRDSLAWDYQAQEDGAKVALFQGGINARLDYHLLIELTKALPDWQFWFCGKSVDAPPEWDKLKRRPNVRDFGLVDSKQIAALARQARVGLIPFVQDGLMRRSLPLKAYEYVACGLPTVTIPIDELAGQPDLFRTARTAAEFASSITAVSDSRSDPDRIKERMQAAELQSYDRRFATLGPSLAAALDARRARRPRGNLLVLYDDRSTHVRTIEEHLLAFRTYSRHAVSFMPATGFVPGVDAAETNLDFSAFDAVAVHYSIRLSIEEHLSRAITEALVAFNGVKLLFIQDEYDTTETARRWMERLGFDGVFTNVPREALESVYPKSRFPGVDFIPTLTGYVPEDTSIDLYARPLAERHVLIGYRGRILPNHYGDLGQEKYRIGIEVKRLAEERQLPVDIEVDDSRRIYGNDWYRFLGSCRATLGTESGSNVFDFDGSLARAAQQNPDLTYEAFRDRFLTNHEGKVRMNQVSPKIFEAVRLRTALVLFEGEYSGVVQPDVHFIPLKKNFSNIAEVFSKLQDLDFLRDLTDRAYRDVIESGRYSYRSFVGGADEYLDRRFEGRTRARLIHTPTFAAFGASGVINGLAGEQRGYFLVSNEVLGRHLTRENYAEALRQIEYAMRGKQVYLAPSAANVDPSMMNIAWMVARRLWQMLPEPTRRGLARRLRQLNRSEPSFSVGRVVLSAGLRLMPSSMREVVRYYVR